VVSDITLFVLKGEVKLQLTLCALSHVLSTMTLADWKGARASVIPSYFLFFFLGGGEISPDMKYQTLKAVV